MELKINSYTVGARPDVSKTTPDFLNELGEKVFGYGETGTMTLCAKVI